MSLGPSNVGQPAPPLLLYVVKQLELATRERLDALLKPSGVTALQYTALTVLDRRPAMTSADLARASFIRPQSATDMVAALQRHGFIERTVDPTNQRRLLIGLTDAGRAFLSQYDPLVEEFEEVMLGNLDAGERRSLRRLLDKARRAVEDA